MGSWVNTSMALAWHFLQRELRNRYLGSISGGLWALLQPLAQLAIYGFVWAYVFKQRAPGGDSSPAAIVPFLAVGMWPWNAFAECIMRSTTVIQENSGLIGKVALPRPVLVIAAAGASFLLHGFGFIAIMVVLALLGMKIHLIMLPIALLVFLQLFLLGLGFAFLFSAIQVFVRDLSQVLGQLIPLWMFLSPVLYSRDFLPEAYRGWLNINPFTFYPEYFRSILLGFGDISVLAQVTAFGVAVATCAIGYAVFRRLDPRFEDFL
jgi:lipopolysaccharide transport system permease protein